ncbi:MAG: mannose-1-phosphate guanylyltransferase [Bacteroidales bacterium]|nr:mannose-1-phosphate guanylyltransferase [Bacteroidales bacterium]
MAGGVGSRFWPLSRSSNPKQFLDILGVGRTLLQQTVDRFTDIIPIENIFIVSNAEYSELIHKQIPTIPQENILLEPFRRNTAPCIAYAAYRIKSRDPEARMVVAPSDHLILKEDVFMQVVKKGLRFVEENNTLLTIGIRPSRPETGYGYIQTDKNQNIASNEVIYHKVKTFTEKPDLKLARVFLESGEFFWNSGIFFWSVESILQSFRVFLPEINNAFVAGLALYGTENEEGFIQETYSGCKNISIDYGIMEKADNVYVLTADFGWSDLGTWGSLFEQKAKDKSDNVAIGDKVFLYDTSSSLINSSAGRLVVIQGMEEFIVVDSEDVLLICKKDQEQRIKSFVNDVKLDTGEKYI